MAGPAQIVPDAPFGFGMQRGDAHPAPVARDLQAGPAVHDGEIAHAEPAELLARQALAEHHGEDGAVAQALDGAFGRRLPAG